MIQEEFVSKLAKITEAPVKLIEHLKSLNTAYNNQHYVNCAIIIRAILDYIPPIFGYVNVGQIIGSSEKGQKTLKNSIKCLNDAIRNIADDAIHIPAQKGEILKISKGTIDNQQGNLVIVIDEVIKQLNNNDLRGVVSFSRPKESINKTEEKSKLELFEQYIEEEQRYNEEIDHEERRICKKDELFQIHKKQDYEDFSEPWTQVYPDTFGSGKYSVQLVYNNNIIKVFTFIYCDGGRISVALPKMESDKENNIWEGKDKLGGGYKNITFYWTKNSLDYKLTELIGNFYIYDGIEGVAKMSNIKIK